MTAREFLNKNINPGDKVILNDNITCYFGGYRAYSGPVTKLEHCTYPVFYAVGKNGQMIKRSPFTNNGPALGYFEIKSIRKAKYPKFRVTLFNMASPSETRDEELEADSADAAEQMLHDKHWGDGWGVLSSVQLKD